MIKKLQLRNCDKFTLLDKEDYEKVKIAKWYLFKSSNKEYAYAQVRIINGKIQIPLTFSQIASIRRPKTGNRFLSSKIFSDDNKLTQVFLHRFILNAPKGLEVDHINGDGLDNRKENLRICNRKQNGKNRKLAKNNKTGYHGVYYCEREKRRKRWTATIRINGKKKTIGRFHTKDEAAVAYNEYALKYHGAFATINKLTI